jgi:hypothetical protein
VLPDEFVIFDGKSKLDETACIFRSLMVDSIIKEKRKVETRNSLGMKGPYDRCNAFVVFRTRFFTSELLGVRARSLAIPQK